MPIFYATIVVASLGAFFAVGLSIASKVFAVEKDQLAIEIEEILPQANCGGCGYPGCSGYAKALSEGSAEINLCAPGGEKLLKLLEKLLGKEAQASKKLVAYIHCNAKKSERTYDYKYAGIQDCQAAATLFDGPVSCKYSCLQLGSCERVCPTKAIKYDEFNRLKVDKDLCISCRKCIAVCPHNVITMIPYDAPYAISCNSKDKAGVVKKICKAGCIGCMICEKRFSESGCKVVNFLSEIDYTKELTQIEDASKACPAKCIVET